MALPNRRNGIWGMWPARSPVHRILRSVFALKLRNAAACLVSSKGVGVLEVSMVLKSSSYHRFSGGLGGPPRAWSARIAARGGCFFSIVELVAQVKVSA